MSHLLEQPLDRPLRCLRQVERHAITEGDEARQVGTAHVLAVGANVHQGGIGAEGSALQVDLIVAQGLANFVEIIDHGRGRILRKIERCSSSARQACAISGAKGVRR